MLIGPGLTRALETTPIGRSCFSLRVFGVWVSWFGASQLETLGSFAHEGRVPDSKSPTEDSGRFDPTIGLCRR